MAANVVTNVIVENKSKTIPITVSLDKTENPGGSPVSHLIEAGARALIPKNFDGGCAKMSVNIIRSEDVDLSKKGIDIQYVRIWEGNIPACNDVTLEVVPEQSQVRYKGHELPKCTACDKAGGVSKDILVENKGGSSIGPWYNKQQWYWYALLAALVAILLYLAFYRKGK
jgi:hypothetical protein